MSVKTSSTRTISFRVTTNEYVEILSEAKAEKLYISDYILMLLWGKMSRPNGEVPKEVANLKAKIKELEKAVAAKPKEVIKEVPSKATPKVERDLVTTRTELVKKNTKVKELNGKVLSLTNKLKQAVKSIEEANKTAEDTASRLKKANDFMKKHQIGIKDNFLLGKSGKVIQF